MGKLNVYIINSWILIVGETISITNLIKDNELENHWSVNMGVEDVQITAMLGFRPCRASNGSIISVSHNPH